MFIPLGSITVPTPGTPVQATKNQTNPAAPLVCHAFLVEVLPGNTGKVYIGLGTMVRATWVGVIAYLPPPTSTVAPTFSATVAYAPNDIELTQVYIDADNANDGVIISAIIA